MDMEQLLENLVCRNHLLSFLNVDDLVRLCRVCKSVKNHAQDFIRTQKVESKTSIYVDFEAANPFKQYNKFKNVFNDLPKITKVRAIVVFFKNREKSRMLKTPLRNFLDHYGVSITHLALSTLSVLLYSKNTLDFFESLPNVTQLAICRIDLDTDDQEQATGIQIPPSFKKLEWLNIAGCSLYGLRPSEQRKKNYFQFFVKLVETCIPNLKRLSLPFKVLLSNFGTNEVMRLAYTILKAPKLKLEDVDGKFIEELIKTENLLPEMGSSAYLISQINDKVVSIRAPQENSFLLELPHLERMDFEYIDEWKMPSAAEFVRRDWPKLQEIIADGYSNDIGRDLLLLWNFLFGDAIRRESVTTLKIGLVGWGSTESGHAFQRPMGASTAYPNLKILHLGSDAKGIFFDLQQLWSGIPLLEELQLLGGCYDKDFIGKDPANPVFWSLKQLKLLILKVTDEGVTDDFLRNVLCHMPLKIFRIFSPSYDRGHGYESITLDGIKSLLNGKFASTIERLGILGLDLKFVSKKKMKDVQKLFRSSQMA